MSPRTEKQFEEIREEKKQLIMDTALELFAVTGYESTSISMIAKKAKISKGLLYNYFESKEELIKAILNKGIDDMMSFLDPNHDGVLEASEMGYFLEQCFKMLKEHRIFWRLYFSVSTQPSVFKLIEERINELFKPFRKMMVNYFSSMGYEDPLLETILFAALLDGLTFNYVMQPDMIPIERITEELIKRYCSKK